MELIREGEVAVLRMRAGKANAIGAAFLSALNARLDELRGARALVVVGDGAFFSAGLDLPGLLALDEPAMRQFIDSFGAAMQRLFELPMPVVAAVNGHAIAGGCVLALQADVRIAADGPGRIGLNEAQLGIGLPPIVVETLRIQVPATSLLPIAQEGKLFAPRDALGLGLVHEVVAADALLPRALERARELAQIPAASYAHIKAALRRPAIDAVRADGGKSVASWVATWFAEGGRERILATVDKLKKK